MEICETMGMKKFAYLFTLGGDIVISRDNSVQLQHRVKNDSEHIRNQVEAFIRDSFPGDHIQLTNGEFIFCTNLA